MSRPLETVFSINDQPSSAPHTDSSSTQEQKRKRQRLSLVCSYCKRRKIKCDKARPSCSSCVKLGMTCQYEAPHWVNSSLQSVVPQPLAERPKEDLLQMIEKLQGEVEYLKKNSSSMTSTSPASTAGSLDPMEPKPLQTLVDFYEHYNTLSMKGSSHEDHEPLCSLSIHKKDHYLAFFTCYLYITLKVNSILVHGMFTRDYRTRNGNGSSKWLYLLDMGGEDAALADSIDRIVKDRAELFRAKTFPFKTINDSIDGNVDELQRSIIELLPDKATTDTLLDFYFKYMWSVRPYLDREMFEEELNRLVVRHARTGKVELRLAKRSDFATLATLLILLRYAYNSIKLVDRANLDPQYQSIHDIHIPVTLITTAQTCLCFYRVTRKTTLPIIQALLLLRAYCRDAPEDGDGITLFQSQNLYGFILQSALQMGLNRDPVNYTQTANNIREANVRRRIWHSIVAMDAYACVFAGTISTLPDPCHVDVHFPMIVTIDPVEHTERDGLIRESALNNLYFKLTKLVNNVKEKVDLNELLKLLHQTRSYVDTNFALDKLTSLEGFTPGTKAYLSNMSKNNRAVSHQIIQATLELQIHFSLCMVFESNSHMNVSLHKKFFENITRDMCRVFDICGAYLTGDFDKFLTQSFRFEIMPLIIPALFRALSISLGGLLRAYHAEELLSTPLFQGKKNLTKESFDGFIKCLTGQSVMATKMIREHLAPRYYQALKSTSYFNYAFKCVTAHRFKPMSTIIKFLESNDKYDLNHVEEAGMPTFTSAKRDDIRKRLQIDSSLINVSTEWMQVSNFKIGKMGEGSSTETSQIVSINNSNMFLEYSSDELFAGIKAIVKFEYCSAFKAKLPSANEDIFQEELLTQQSRPIFDFPTEDQLELLNTSGRLKTLGDFDFFEQGNTDEEFFKNLLETMDLTQLTGEQASAADLNNMGFSGVNGFI